MKSTDNFTTYSTNRQTDRQTVVKTLPCQLWQR